MTEPAASRVVVVTNPQGLHLRPFDLIVKRAVQFVAKIELVKDQQRVDGKSMMQLLTIASPQGTELRVEATGPDAQAALDALAELFASGFGENEI